MAPFDGTFERVPLQGEVSLHLAPADKFKTALVKVFVRADLDRETATEIALLPSVLRRGTRAHPTLRDLTRHLEALYGTQLGGDILKIGEQQVVALKVEVAGDSFLPAGTDAFARAAALLRDLLLDPALDGNGDFPANVVSQEKEKHKQFIDGLINDKGTYAAERCSAEMCKGEPFEVYEYGSVPDLERVTPRSLAERWRALLEKAPIDVFAIGAIDRSAAIEILSRAFDRSRPRLEPLRGTLPNPARRPARFVREPLPVKQGKLCIGFRTGSRVEDESYFGLLVMNGVLGAFPHSKLFRNVREKAGLCYYASSSIERTKGLVFVQCGIEKENFEKARDLSLEQLDAIRRGEVTDEELENTRRALRFNYRSLLDRPSYLANTVYILRLAGRDLPLDELISRIERVTKEQVVEAARAVWLDLTYFLEPDGTVVDDEEPAEALAEDAHG
ncbi:insulinase family protein [bacterium]|nr:insulinase family protein [bacterium]